jgi:AcrR family transcriptional regulator
VVNGKASPATGRIRMLDAAEILFAAKGFDGTSVRDITRQAKVEVGLVPYHFKTKAELFRETMLRRAPAFAAALNAALDEVLARDPEPAARTILATYLDAHIALVQSSDPGWRSYIRLAAETMLRLASGELSGGATAIYRPVMNRYEHILIENNSWSEPAEVRRIWAIFRRTILSVLIEHTIEGAGTLRELQSLRETCIEVFSRSFEPRA